jgi:hypothetical protein
VSKNRKVRWTPEEDELLRKLVVANVPVSEIAADWVDRYLPSRHGLMSFESPWDVIYSKVVPGLVELG